MRRIQSSIIFTCQRNTSNYRGWNIPVHANPDLDYLCDTNNTKKITDNINCRKGVGNIKLVQDLKKQMDNITPSDAGYSEVLDQFYKEASKIPNKTHPSVLQYDGTANVVKHIGNKPNFSFEPRDFDVISKRLKLVRTDHLGNLSGSRSYYLLGDMAHLEQALITYTLSELLRNKFSLVSVPDLVNRSVIEGCGMNTRGVRNQVYTLESQNDVCLSGTSEMALAGYFCGKVINEVELPAKLAAVSRCYRAETSSIAEERGIYRVHEFTKVEMFAVTSESGSEQQLDDFRVIQEQIFSKLGLYCQVLDMPPDELGSPAFRKYDIEAWLPGRKMFGEISSCSNCTDYQSRSLNIKYTTANGEKFAHTVNGTACAIPRMLIAIVETFQNDNGTITIPSVLQKYMQGQSAIGKQKRMPELRLIKHK